MSQAINFKGCLNHGEPSSKTKQSHISDSEHSTAKERRKRYH